MIAEAVDPATPGTVLVAVAAALVVAAVLTSWARSWWQGHRVAQADRINARTAARAAGSHVRLSAPAPHAARPAVVKAAPWDWAKEPCDGEESMTGTMAEAMAFRADRARDRARADIAGRFAGISGARSVR